MKPRWNRTLSACLVAAVGLLPALAQNPPRYTITTVAGIGTPGYSGDNGQAASAELNFPIAIHRNAAGNLYIADTFNNRIRVIESGGNIRLVAGDGTAGYQGDGASATAAKIAGAYGIATDSANNLYIVDPVNNVIRRVTAAGTISTFAGTGSRGFVGDGGAATSAWLNGPTGIAIDAAGNVYVCDTNNSRVRKIDTSGNISTFAGDGRQTLAGDGGPAVNAALNRPVALAVDSIGNVYIADTYNHRIRKVDTNGIITTVAGGGNYYGFSGDGGPATEALLAYPRGVAVDANGRIYIGDSVNQRIRVVMEDGRIHTIAGSGYAAYGGDGGNALAGVLQFPRGIAVDSATGRVWIADTDNHRIRLLTPEPQSPVLSQGGVITTANFGGFDSAAPGSWLELYGHDLATRTREWSEIDFVEGKAPTTLGGTTVTIDGREAYVSYVSGNQVNVQVPPDVIPGEHAVVVHTSEGDSAPYAIQVEETLPGLLAPPAFKIGGKQYVAGVLSDGAFAAPAGAIAGANTRPARPGETVTFYGVGFGPVTPFLNAGEVASRARTLALPLQISIGGVPATVSYAGLAPGTLGLYQFNVTVPVVPAADAELHFRLDGNDNRQTLYLAVGQ